MAHRQRRGSFLRLMLLLFTVVFLPSTQGGRSTPSHKLIKAISRTTGTDLDAIGLLQIITQYPLLYESDASYCLWTWVGCDSASGRVVSLFLGNNNLIGLLPDFSLMDALKKIYLDRNRLSGAIPSFLGQLPDLEILNLAYNQFSGQVPYSLACNRNLNLSTEGNPNLRESSTPCSSSTNNYTPPLPPPATARTFTPPVAATANPGFDFSSGRSSPPSKTNKPTKNNTPVIVGSSISTFLVFWIAVGIFATFRHKAKVAAAVAAAGASSPAGSKLPTKAADIRTEEVPINVRSTNASP